MNAFILACALMTSPCANGQCARPTIKAVKTPVVAKARSVRPVRRIFGRLRFPNCG